MRKKIYLICLIILQILFSGLTLSVKDHARTPHNDYSLKSSAVDYSNITIISDGYNGVYWNEGTSYDPEIIVDNNNKLHVVWEDSSELGLWGGGDSDWEILYASFTDGSGWSNVTVISDGYGGNYWNNAGSTNPTIAIDSNNKFHVAWQDETDGIWGVDEEIMYATYTDGSGWSNATVISDGYGGSYWNDGDSRFPSIAVDSNDQIHVVWYDYTAGVWGSDIEIMYAKYTDGSGWSNVTIISDGFGGSYWNDGTSYLPQISVDSNDQLHVVWYDDTDGVWGGDEEIMYTTYTGGSGWSNATVISDGYGGSYWNNESSKIPCIAIDSNDVIYVAWHDNTDGVWGTDYEIMYVTYTDGSGWSNATVISDGYEGSYWNDGGSIGADISIENNNDIHIVWSDYTDGVWGSDAEIMYAEYTDGSGWSNATVISDGYGGSYWNNDSSRVPAITVSANQVHVVWYDSTNGPWGTDIEIMYTSFGLNGDSPRGFPFEALLLILGISIIGIAVVGLVIYKKRKRT